MRCFILSCLVLTQLSYQAYIETLNQSTCIACLLTREVVLSLVVDDMLSLPLSSVADNDR
jgi:hypothetical protein